MVFKNHLIYKKFSLEFFTYHAPEVDWPDFILLKDLGIASHWNYITLEVDTNYYRIIDEKKWAIAKIKYGF
jgi:hypothetical protein